jgi:signal transduction histidine kinase
MKLKNKLFLSYLFIIAFYSFAIIILTFQLWQIDRFTQGPLQQDVQKVIDLSYQQHLLEKIYDNYLVLRIARNLDQDSKHNLRTLLNVYEENWIQFKSRRPAEKNYPSLFLFFVQENDRMNEEKLNLMENCENLWRTTYRNVYMALNEGKITDIKGPVNQLRQTLIELEHLIGKQTSLSAERIKSVSEYVLKSILITIGIIIVIGIFVTILILRRFSKPMESLRRGVEQIAIQNFDIHFENKTRDEIGELATAFEQMALRLRENNQFKTSMLSQFTHEMKSPLGAIKQSVQLLQSGLGDKIDRDQKRLLSIIQGNNQTLFDLIDTILSSSKEDNEQVKLNIRRENIVKVFTQTLMLLTPVIKEKNIKVELNYSAKKIECDLDIEKMQEVFQNLIANAVKFSPEHATICVTIYLKYPFVTIVVKDEGIGIPPKEIPYIFEKLYRATNSKKISVKGTGLGLYISSRILKAHGAQIQVDSKENEGTEFKITIPLNRRIAVEGEWIDAG